MRFRVPALCSLVLLGTSILGQGIPNGDRPAPPKAKDSAPKRVVLLVSGSLEYKSDESLAAFQKVLEADPTLQCRRAFRRADDDVPGLTGLKDCDLAVFFTRRLTVDGDQLQAVKDYLKAGKPVVGIRTASHGFQKYLAMDRDIFGGDYKNHYKPGPKCAIKIDAANRDNPILKGFAPYDSESSLYRNKDVVKDATILLRGTIPEAAEPLAWTRQIGAQKVFYTSLGHPADFANANFQKLLKNAVEWALAK